MAYSPGDYPLPAHALYVWLGPNGLCVGVPPSGAGERGHTIELPWAKLAIAQNDAGTAPRSDQLGWHTLLGTLRARQGDVARPGPFGTHAPTQRMVEDALRAKAMVRALAPGSRTRPQAPPAGPLTLEALGLLDGTNGEEL